MGKKEIYCEKCSLEINNREDLVVSTYFFYVFPYHDQCFARSLKGWGTVFLANTPINGTAGTTKAIIAAIFLLFILFFSNGSYNLIAFILLIIPALRVYSWLAYERHLD